MNLTDLLIISACGAEYRGIVQCCLLAGDVWRLTRLEWVASTSMLKALAAKHGSTIHGHGPQVQGPDRHAARAAHLL